MNDLFKVNEKVVVVTGATGILAGGAAQYLQKNGATVVYLRPFLNPLQKWWRKRYRLPRNMEPWYPMI